MSFMVDGSLRVLLVGSGGREHAIARALSKSPLVGAVYVAPGNGGTAQGLPKVENVSINELEFGELVDFAVDNDVNLVVPGPEAPLVGGIEVSCRQAGIRCFGPSQQAAQLEGSKAFSKEFMRRHKIPTADYRNFTDAESAHGYLDAIDHGVVVKASGLAAGKGVIIPKTKKEAHEAVDAIMVDKNFGDAGNEIVIEEFLEGEELSILSFCDGYTIRSLPPAQDHKRIGDNDTGPMTGGMGCYSPCKIATPALVKQIHDTILQPTINAMRRNMMPFKGILFTGLMITKSGPKVLEYNVRFGDPETEAVLPMLKTDLAEIMIACTDGFLDAIELQIEPNMFSAVIITAAPGYPGTYQKNLEIQIDDESLPAEGYVYHAGTSRSAGTLATSGGRVLAINATGASLEDALDSAYTTVNLVNFEGMQYRTDIGRRDLKKVASAGLDTTPTRADFAKVSKAASLTYAGAGVSVADGNLLVNMIKPYVASTKRPGADAEIGGFGGIFDLGQTQYNVSPKLVAAIDGVGTKLYLAHAIGKHDTIGIDCVAMNVNDLVVQGAEPLLFLDCFTCGKLDVHVASTFVKGVAEGCKTAGCVLAGGETAEMPGLFTVRNEDQATGDVYDAVGASIGAVPHDRALLPDKLGMKKGDILLGLASSGVHSNGFSLVRQVLERAGLSYSDLAPWAEDESSVGESLLTPTRIYVKPLLRAVSRNLLKGMAHITGGGLVDNVPRMLPEHLAAEIDVSSYEVPAVLKWLKKSGNIQDVEFATAFNTGLGMVIVVDREKAVDAIMELEAAGEKVWEIGSLVDRSEGGDGTVLKGLDAWGKWS